MRSTLRYFYIANLDNKTVVLDTSLMPFWTSFQQLEPAIRNYDFFYREFKKTDVIIQQIDGKEYLLQKITVNGVIDSDSQDTKEKRSPKK